MKANSVVAEHPNIIHSDEKSITFNVETLTPPKGLLPETNKAEVLKAFSNQIEFIPNPKQQLVKNGNHPFLFGLYQAYSEHRPFVLSPDMLWLLICQAFSRTVNYNSKAFRPYLVDFDKKETLKTDWIEKILPLIKKIKSTSEGQIDIDFWRNIFKVHTIEDYGNPKSFDGWICHFYPFNKNGKRINLAHIANSTLEDIFKELPSEIINVDFKLKVLNPISPKYDKIFPMEFWAGFIGLCQDSKTMAIRPEIDWFVAHQAPIQQLEMKHKNGISLNNIAEIPDYVYQFDFIEQLSIVFLKEIKLPKKLTKVKIRVLRLEGKANLWTRLKIRWQFRDAYLVINGKRQKEIPFYKRKLV